MVSVTREGPRVPSRIQIGTRGSRLALWQAERVRDLLEALPDAPSGEVVSMRSSGEIHSDTSLSALGIGVFTREIDAAVLDGRVDLGVHSLKDLPTELASGLVLAAVPERGPERDAWISVDDTPLDELPDGARIGTSSPRRGAQILARRPDLEIVPLRGNVETRLRKVKELGLAGTVLAEAGLRRLGHGDLITHVVSEEWIVPAVGQGALGIVARADRVELLEVLAKLDHASTRRRVDAERSFLKTLRGGCQVPAGASSRVENASALHLDGVLCSKNGGVVLRDQISGSPDEAERLGESLARRLLDRGGEAILATLRDTDGGQT